jgi:hypothetical protein
VPAERIRQVLGIDLQTLKKAALELGLPDKTPDPRWLSRGYVSIIRANWHLLNYKQLLLLLNWTPERMLQTLTTEDALWVKLGQLKPAAKPLVWRPLSTDEKEMTRNVHRIIAREFPDRENDFTGYKVFDFFAKTPE